MPRRARVFGEGLFYHVFNHVTREERPFAVEGEAGRFVDLVREVALRDGWRIVAWCVMPNHFHLLLRVSSVPLWRSMHDLQHRYAMTANRRAGAVGPVWRSRYQAKVVVDEGYLARVLAYIHLNPVAAGLVRDPARYKWSGHLELLGKRPDPLVDVAAALALLEPDPASAVKSYTSLVKSLREEHWLAQAPQRLPWWGRTVRRLAPELVEPERDQRRPLAVVDRPKVQVMALVAGACSELHCTVGEVASRLRTAEALLARQALTLVLVDRWGVRSSELSEVLGRTSNGVSHLLGSASRRSSREPDFSSRVEDLDRLLLLRFGATLPADAQ